MSETTSFNPNNEYINALLSKVAYEGVSKPQFLMLLRILKILLVITA